MPETINNPAPVIGLEDLHDESFIDNTLSEEEIKAQEEKKKEEEKAKAEKEEVSPDTPSKGNLQTEENKEKVLNLFRKFNTEDISEQDTKTKEAILKAYKGEGFDDEGNIVDKEGNILKSFEEVFNSLDNNKNLDKDGNQIDKEGNIVKTALELAADKSYVNKLHLNSSHNFTDENGKVKIYEDNEKGLEEFTQDLANERFSKLQESFTSRYSEAIKIAKHLELGGTLDNYNVKTDWDKLDKKSLTKDQKLSYIVKSFKTSGLEQERIDNLVDLIDKGNTVDTEFDSAVKHLKDYDKQTELQLEQAYAQKEAEELKTIENHWNSVKTIIDNDKMNLVKIPSAEKEAFYNYVSDAVDEQGRSQDMVDLQNLSTEDKLALSYLRFKKLNLKELVKQEVQDTRIESLTDLIIRSSNIKNNDVTPSSVTGNNNDTPVAIGIADLLG